MHNKSNKKEDKFKFRLGAARKTSLFALTGIFLVLMGLIIYGDLPLNVNVIAVTVIIVFLALLVVIYFFIKDILRKLQEAYGKIQFRITSYNVCYTKLLRRGRLSCSINKRVITRVSSAIYPCFSRLLRR